LVHHCPELTGDISGIYSFSNGAAAAPDFEIWRGRADLGPDYSTGRATYFGLGTNFESYGENLEFDMRL
jgi:hypothetical protein